MVAQFGEDVRGGKFLVVVFKGLQRLLRLVLTEENVVPCGRHVLALAEHILNLVHRRQSLVVLVLLEVEVDQREIDVVLFREVLQQLLVGRDGQVVLSCH